jgi:hypothetical protein
MKIKANYITKAILTEIFFSILITSGYSQGTDSRSSSGSKMYAGIFINPLKTGIANEKFSSGSTLNNASGSGLNIAIEGGYFFTDLLGVSIGAGYGSYAATVSMDSYTTSYTTTDTENESYEMRISGKAISENQKISFISIPVCLNVKYPFTEKIGGYAKAGISFNIPLSKTYAGSGTFTYDGYYPAYPVLLQNVPAYGFPTDLSTVASGDLQINSFNIGIVASGGAYYALNDNMQILIGIQFNKSIGNISGYKADANYRLTSKATELNSVMGGSTTAGVQAIGLSIGFKYYLK